MSKDNTTKPTKEPVAVPESAKAKQHYDVEFYHAWCKACGLCMAFCPKKIILPDRVGKPHVDEPDKCIGCRFCEMHCPDFAITVSERGAAPMKEGA